jgi:hypothetical protein
MKKSIFLRDHLDGGIAQGFGVGPQGAEIACTGFDLNVCGHRVHSTLTRGKDVRFGAFLQEKGVPGRTALPGSGPAAPALSINALMDLEHGTCRVTGPDDRTQCNKKQDGNQLSAIN